MAMPPPPSPPHFPKPDTAPDLDPNPDQHARGRPPEPLEELKIRARLRLNAQSAQQPELRLRQCLVHVAQGLGFATFEQARQVLGGQAEPGADMGSFWHAPRCESLLNLWFAHWADARAARSARPGTTLLPYRRQFVVVAEPYLQALGLDAADPAWAEAGHDLVQAQGSAPWRHLVMQRLRADPASFAPRRLRD